MDFFDYLTLQHEEKPFIHLLYAIVYLLLLVVTTYGLWIAVIIAMNGIYRPFFSVLPIWLINIWFLAVFLHNYKTRKQKKAA